MTSCFYFYSDLLGGRLNFEIFLLDFEYLFPFNGWLFSGLPFLLEPLSFSLITVFSSSISILIHPNNLPAFLEFIPNYCVMTQFDQNHYQIDPDQSYFAHIINHPPHYQYHQNNFVLDFSKNHHLIPLSSYLSNNSFWFLFFPWIAFTWWLNFRDVLNSKTIPQNHHPPSYPHFDPSHPNSKPTMSQNLTIISF